MGIYFGIIGIRDSNSFSVFFMLPVFVISGGIVVLIAWQNLRHFGPTSIRAIVGLLAFAAHSSIFTLLRPFSDTAWELKMEALHFATFVVPILLAYLLYRVVSRKLIELTETQNIQQPNARDSSKAADCLAGKPGMHP